MSLPWFRLYNETISDPKIQTLDLCTKWMWVVCLCVSSASGERGTLRFGDVTVTFRELSQIAGVTSQDGEVSVNHLLERGMLNRGEDGVLRVTNWDKRQYPSDSSAERTRKYREKKREKVTSQERHGDVTVTGQILDTDTDTDTDKRENLKNNHSPSESGSSTKVVDPTPHQKIIDLYHEICPTAPRVVSWKEGTKNLKARWREDKDRQNLMWWSAFFQRVAASDFLSGRKPGRSGPFFASLAWMVKAANFEKILNGAYDSKKVTINYGDPEALLRGMLQVPDKSPRSLRDEIPDIGIVDTEGRVVNGEA